MSDVLLNSQKAKSFPKSVGYFRRKWYLCQDCVGVCPKRSI